MSSNLCSGLSFQKSSSFIGNPASQPKFTIHLVFTGFNNSLLDENRNRSELNPLKWCITLGQI